MTRMNDEERECFRNAADQVLDLCRRHFQEHVQRATAALDSALENRDPDAFTPIQEALEQASCELLFCAAYFRLLRQPEKTKNQT